VKSKFKLKQKLLLSVLTAGLLFAPLSGLEGDTVSAAAVVKTKTKVMTTAVHSSVLSVYVDGKKLGLSPSPVVRKGTTIVPMRTIFKALKASVTWEPTTKTIIAVKDRTTITLQLGSKNAVKNGKSVPLAVPPQQIKGATMVPLRFIAEALGADVRVDASARAIRITSYEEQMRKKEEQAAEEDELEQAAPTLTTEQVVEQNDDKVVMITTDVAQGSGVVIGENRILTNLHVIQDATKATVTLLDGSTFEVEGVVGYDEDADLAVIQTKKPLGVDPVTVGYGIRKGDHVVAIGSPLGLQNTVSDGIVSNLQYDGGTQIYQISVPIDHGSSGGGLFDDYGDLVGITSSGVDATHADLNFAVSSMNIFQLMGDIESQDPKAKIAFLPKTLPSTLVGASNDEIRELMDKQFADIQTSQGTTELKRFEVTRDAQGWLVITAVIDPAFYMQYGHMASDDLRFWAIDTGYKLHQMLPQDTIQLAVYYEQVFSFEPRGFAPGEVTAVGDGTWRVRFPVVQMQGKEKMIVQVRS
jgi:S1-C subfamily serine protease